MEVDSPTPATDAEVETPDTAEPPCIVDMDTTRRWGVACRGEDRGEEGAGLGVRRALLTDTGGAWRFIEWDGAAWRVASSPRFTVDAPDGRLWLRLRCADERRRATKLWTFGAEGWAKEPENPGTWFEPEPIWVEDTAEAWAKAWAKWADDPGAFLVRGVLARGFGGELVRKAKRPDKGAWLGPHPVGRRVIVCDFDKLDARALVGPGWPGGVRWPTPDEAADLVRRVLRRVLPGRFGGASAAYRWSASTGVPGGARGPVGWSRPCCHVALVLDRPVCDESLGEWLDTLNPPPKSVQALYRPRVDGSIAESVQALFLASPIFHGAASPWPADFPRVGLLEGKATTLAPDELLDGWAWQKAEDEKKAAELAALADAADKAKLRELYAMGRGTWGDGWAQREERRDAEQRQRFAEGRLVWAADRVAGAGEGSRHETVLKTANTLGRFVAGGVLDEGRARAVLAQAWSQAAGGREDGPRAIEDGLKEGKRSPRTWAEIREEREHNGR